MNSNLALSPEKQKKYKEIISLLYASFQADMEKEEKEREEREAREKIKAEIQRQKYLESLKPISFDEFVNEIKLLHKRYKNFLKYRQENDILFISIDLNFNKIISRAKLANNGLELAEILDQAKAIMHDMEAVKDVVTRTDKIINEKIKQIKQIEK
ncbi:MAG: hypothetical protein IJ638_01425 [Alphaproteobacteria bacterium]|nr:hypothetical protein [Alphaproteobacteria bacterium]